MTARQRTGAVAAGDALLALVLAVQALRLLAAVVGGIATAGTRQEFTPSRFHTGETLAQLGGAGDGVGLLLMLVAVALLVWRTAGARAAAPLHVLSRLRNGTSWLLVLTAVSAVLAIIGLTLEATAVGSDWQRVVSVEGFAVADLVGALGTLVIVRRLSIDADGAEDVADDGEAPAAVFAVDRRSGAVLAWPSMREARAGAPLFGVQDDEYEWFLDDGTVLLAVAEGDDVRFTLTEEERPEDLLRHLQDHVQRRNLTIDDDEVDEPLAYVDPIARDHYLEMWPGWMRWIGRLTR